MVQRIKMDGTSTTKRLALAGTFVVLAIAGTSGALYAQAKSAVDPYWMSLRDDKAFMRTGPRDSYPIKWVYQRKFMPLKVVAKEADWRKVEDMDGDQGWMHLKLLSTTRTAVVIAEGPEPLRESAADNARIGWRAEKGVVGKISDCSPNWCLFDVAGRLGFIKRDAIWGDEDLPGEKNK